MERGRRQAWFIGWNFNIFFFSSPSDLGGKSIKDPPGGSKNKILKIYKNAVKPWRLVPGICPMHWSAWIHAENWHIRVQVKYPLQWFWPNPPWKGFGYFSHWYLQATRIVGTKWHSLKYLWKLKVTPQKILIFISFFQRWAKLFIKDVTPISPRLKKMDIMQVLLPIPLVLSFLDVQ